MLKKKKLVILTGAGISAESGIQTFRDSDGLWEQHRIEDVATPFAFQKNPQLVLNFYNERRKKVRTAQPNAGHKTLAELEKYFDVTIITQNIDDLHERAGSSHIIHLHGEIFKSRSCNNPSLIYDCPDTINLGDLAEDGSQLRPHIVWFYEDVPQMEAAIGETQRAEILMIIGTSLQVYPAAGLAMYAPYDALKFLVDPHIPEVSHIPNLEIVNANATIGVPELAERLINEYGGDST
ncbi:MAG: NAD-dependent deacylase [Chitinophagales bacterium]|nr:NAD-dependent deacylase [Chitinophagales bacterium]